MPQEVSRWTHSGPELRVLVEALTGPLGGSGLPALAVASQVTLARQSGHQRREDDAQSGQRLLEVGQVLLRHAAHLEGRDCGRPAGDERAGRPVDNAERAVTEVGVGPRVTRAPTCGDRFVLCPQSNLRQEALSPKGALGGSPFDVCGAPCGGASTGAKTNAEAPLGAPLPACLTACESPHLRGAVVVGAL